MANPAPIELHELFSASDGMAREEAWARLVENHSRLLFHLARSLGGGYDATMDRYLYILERLRQDDYRRLRAYRADGAARFSTWLLVVARRLCHDHHRERYGRSRPSVPDAARRARRRLADLDLSSEVEQVVDASALSAADEVERREGHEALRAELAQLGADDRLLLTYWFDDELTAGEIARLLGLPTSFHVYRRVRALAKTLRQRLDARGLGADGR
jgi:RNA polymerase sigma factor (sigma-70 family)